jgi:hypothetical protein
VTRPFAPSLALLAVVVAAAAGCAGPEAQIPADVLLRMQAEARTEIYDRENDVAIARNRADDLRLRDAEIRRRKDDLDETAKRARARLTRLGGAARASKIDKPLSARRAYLDAQLRLLGAQRSVAEAQVAAARGRLEQARERALVRTGRALARSMKPFDDAVEALEKKLRDAEHRQQDLRLECEKSYEAWKGAEDEYAAATGDRDTAVWVE